MSSAELTKLADELAKTFHFNTPDSLIGRAIAALRDAAKRQDDD